MEDLEIDEASARSLARYGFERSRFEELRARLRRGEVSNVLNAEIEPPSRAEIWAPGRSEVAELKALGQAAIARGEVGAVCLCGGMATRFGGVVKAAVPAIGAQTFLDLKIADARAAAGEGRVPLFLMTSFATDEAVRALGAEASSTRAPIACFAQSISLRLTPEGALFRDAEGRASAHAPGHGDLSFALRSSGMLKRFLAAGGKYLFVSNVDNLAATLDPWVIGAHIAAQRPITVEVAPKFPGDQGGAPARVDGHLQIVEGFRFPPSFDQDQIDVFNTNTFVFSAAAIDRAFDLDFFVVQKNVEGRVAIQFERLVGQLTAFLPTTFLKVSREGSESRFEPIKAPEDLKAKEAQLRALLEARGIPC